MLSTLVRLAECQALNNGASADIVQVLHLLHIGTTFAFINTWAPLHLLSASSGACNPKRFNHSWIDGNLRQQSENNGVYL
jgi:hypothetical protein